MCDEINNEALQNKEEKKNHESIASSTTKSIKIDEFFE